MQHLARLLLVAGFCVGTLGAAGFAKTPEPEALPVFGLGLALVAAGGLLWRRSLRGGADGDAAVHGERERYRALVLSVRDSVGGLASEARREDPLSVREEIDQIVQGDLFDLTSGHEDLAALLGFDAYSSIWEGVAGGERLLNRAWSMLTDGAVDEGLAELPLAHRQFESAVAAFERV